MLRSVVTRRLVLLNAALAVVLVACGADDRRVATGSTDVASTTARPASSATVPSPTSVATLPTTAPTNTAAQASTRVRLTDVGTFRQPIALVSRPGTGTLYVAEQGGQVKLLDGTTVLDMHSEVTTGNEQGLLGIAFAPDGSLLYLCYTDVNGDSRLVEYRMGADAKPILASRREVLAQAQPYANHNGGNIVFGPDGYLYLGLGDGGAAGDPQNRAQDLSTLLGKIIRIDPREHGTEAYRVPADNPFVGTAGARPEIWSYGLRNPWRFSFDRSTGDLWIGDVGQNLWEEIDHSAGPAPGKGVNYGWSRWEGTHPYDTSRSGPGAVPPVFEYGHGPGCSVTGGFLYRGTAVAALQGAYLFSDYCQGGVRLLEAAGSTGLTPRDLGLDIPNVSSFGQDANGEVYVLSLGGRVARLDPF